MFYQINPNINSDKIGPYSILNKNYDINIEDRGNIEMKDCCENTFIITDGSKTRMGTQDMASLLAQRK